MLGSLDPAKLLVLLVIALVVLGPERLPKAARQLGAAWRELSRIRQQVTDEVRSALPDLGLDDLDLPHLPKNPSAAVSGFVRDLTGGLVGRPGGANGTNGAGGSDDANGGGNVDRAMADGDGANGTATAARRSNGTTAWSASGDTEVLRPASGQWPRRLAPGEPVPERACLVVTEPSRGELAVVFDDPAMN